MTDNWRNMAPTPPKGESMPQTPEQFAKVCAMRDEVIEDQRWEIVRLKRKVNHLQQKLKCRPKKSPG